MSIPNKFPPIMDGNPQDILGAIKLAARAVMDVCSLFILVRCHMLIISSR